MKAKIIIGVSAVAMALQGVALAVVKNKEQRSFCPGVSQIKKNQVTQKWHAQTKNGTWKSYQTSFATNLTTFVGAQWIGEGVGQVTCVYKSEQRFTMDGNLTIQPELPVMIVFHTLTYQPLKGKWKHNGQGVYNCNSFYQKNCPFKIHLKKQIKSIYQEAESLKTTDTDPLQPESY